MMPAKMKDGPVRALAAQLEQLYTQVLCPRLLLMRWFRFVRFSVWPRALRLQF
jgi:hypothetical protein